MAIQVRIPTPLQKFTGSAAQVEVEAGTVKEMVTYLGTAYPGIQERLCDDTGKLRRFINVYVNGEDVRFLEGDATTLKTGDEVSIVPAIAGG